MVDMRSTQPKKTSDIFVKCNTQLVVFILNELQIVRLLPDEGTFHSRQKNTFHSQHEKVKTQKTTMCSSWSKRNSSPSNLLFLETTLISLLTNQNLITVDSKRTVQKLIRLSQMFEPEHKKKHHQTQLPILNRLRLKT